MGIFTRKPKPAPAENKVVEPASVESPKEMGELRTRALEVEIPPGDPLLPFLVSASGVVEVDKLNLESPTLRELKEAGVRITVPLVSQGELIGLLNLGPRLSEQEYSSDDYRLIGNLATQAAPALRVAQLARQQQVEARERERMENEMRVARIIQQTLLPKKLPDLPGWQVAALWQPARAVGGDFYDFIAYPDGRLVIFTGDVTDKGVPAALVMATTRSVLRSAAEILHSPGEILGRANNQLCPDIPLHMFVTCLCAILDPATGRMVYANAGHNPPYQRTKNGVLELRATGMPLGLLPDMPYDEKEALLAPGDSVLLYSDGLVEAHNPQGEMFSFPRVRSLVGDGFSGAALIEYLLKELAEFTTPGWEQEDDVTFLVLDHLGTGESQEAPEVDINASFEDVKWRSLAEFTLPSAPGNERQAMQQVEEVTSSLGLSEIRLERLKTAVAEATMNAMEHGNQYRPELLVKVKVLASEEKLAVFITDFGGNKAIPESQEPDLEAKLAGIQSPRGWGLFLIKNMVDEMNVTSDETHHTIEIVLNLEGDKAK